ncbi:hypothetical protein ACOME3_008544 [Neoechinorhynchus agilis]
MKMRLDKPIFTTVIKYMATLESFKDQDPRVILLIRCLRNSIIPSFITNRVRIPGELCHIKRIVNYQVDDD